MLDQLSVIIVTHNSHDSLALCLDALAKAAPDPEVLIIDNASVDDSAAIAKEFGSAKVIINEWNTGFSAACNQGIKAASGSYLLFLNPDAILRPDAVKLLLQALKVAPHDVVGAGPKLIRSSEGPGGERVIDSAGIALSRGDLSPYDKGQGQYDHGQYDSAPYFGASGACVLFQRDRLESLAINGELFDEDFFAYYEDVDLAWRAGLFGYRYLFVPDALVVHDRKNPRSKSRKVQGMAFVNRYFCAIKNDSNLADHFPRTALKESARMAYRCLSEPGFGKAFGHLAGNLGRMLGKRRIIQSKRAVSPDRLPENS